MVIPGANARIKALALRALAPKDAWIVSDDSGLEVDPLGGALGILCTICRRGLE